MAAAAFHAGERALQERVGVAERMAEVGARVIRDHMPQQHRDFFRQLPFLVAGLRDAQGQPWAGVLAGPPGFMHSPHERVLRIDGLPAAFDPLAPLLQEGAPIGLLGIEQHTRRRNRMNGWVAQADPGGLSVVVGQSFGNCAKYIQARRAEYEPARAAPGVAESGTGLDVAARETIRRADTFFIATAHPQAAAHAADAHGVDVSHRGGRPGFVRVDGDVLTVPDFTGNVFFNTFGNLALEPRCSLLFLDYDHGDCTWVTARGEVLWDGEDLRAFEGAQRLLRLRAEAFLRVRAALPLRWGAAEAAPELARTGHW
jgi:predicted pyridoxine 5'-phosphate oxidase superfamily flavin-nucleotide-binding protein